ncbi:WD40/YVTN/BNR-like repeat-containing protein [Mesoflavibacter zeaxanthinifaciens]|uniref:WD40/YVTN/BNR-like repeat-containing protein n=1 Tax=Mesoflavibacter zeaxanthinifaciens TaxID=393060 RepID=UPI003A9103DA
MKLFLQFIIAFMSLLIVFNCKSLKEESRTEKEVKNFTSVEIKTLIEDSTLNVRALEYFDTNKSFGFLTSTGNLGAILTRDNEYDNNEINKVVYPTFVDSTNSKLNFRSLALVNNLGFALSIGNPALLYRIDSEGVIDLVYQENHPKAFYDSMEFWNDQEGIAIGDPTDDCMSIIITRDGGDTWTKLSCEDLPKANEGEAAFAASDTNIAIVGDKTWVATGGKSSRILFSADKGKTWDVFDTPIIQGKETTGMYSIDFYDENHGFAIGGDYTDADANQKNKIVTNDGGKTWQVVADGSGPGYRSCVQYVPNSNAQQLVAIGFKGIDYSAEAGQTWKHLSDEGFYTLRFLNDSTAYAAGNGRISKLSFK